MLSKDEIAKVMAILEGYRTEVYKCTAGHNTIGFGFNMDQPGAEDVWNKLKCKESFTEVRNGLELISYETAKVLLEDFWKHCETKAESRCTSLGVVYSTLPDWHKFILADIVYNTGSIAGWTKVIKEIDPSKVLYEARRNPKKVMDGRVCKIATYFGFTENAEDCQNLGLVHSKYCR